MRAAIGTANNFLLVAISLFLVITEIFCYCQGKWLLWIIQFLNLKNRRDIRSPLGSFPWPQGDLSISFSLFQNPIKVRNKVLIYLCIPRTYLRSGKRVWLDISMAPHSSILAWKIPWMEEPGGLQSMGSRSRIQLSNFTFHFSLSCTGEGNGNPLRFLAWRIPGTEEPGRLPSLGSHRVRHDWSDLAAAAAAAAVK